MGERLLLVAATLLTCQLLNILGHFYYKYQRHGQLISINKRHTGKLNDEFNMRHDWNSLLTDNLDLRVPK
ncbi:FOXRED2 [Bugula neritina]|uniref:FOXRED2 n=1 Tax=Bugula neritina TaxID=10212 RepID=A0A7J7KD91_BUGNE|nr:FOXRED2 [Bugula neritina]